MIEKSMRGIGMNKKTIFGVLLLLTAGIAIGATTMGSYPFATPVTDDYVTGVDVSDTAQSDDGSTRNFLFSDFPISDAVQDALDAIDAGAGPDDDLIVKSITAGSPTGCTEDNCVDEDFEVTGIFGAGVSTYDATDAADTNVTVGTELTTTNVIITGDNDSDDDEIDLQDGTRVGQELTLIAGTGIDFDDVITVDIDTDSTYTGGINITLDEAGDSFTILWTGATYGWILKSHPE
jgi:hypothetical protein